jgi:hypothetical protein
MLWQRSLSSSCQFKTVTPSDADLKGLAFGPAQAGYQGFRKGYGVLSVCFCLLQDCRFVFTEWLIFGGRFKELLNKQGHQAKT